MASLKGGSGARTRIISLQQTPIRSLTSLSLWWSKSFFDRDPHRGANWACEDGSWFSTDKALSACCVFCECTWERQRDYNFGFRHHTEEIQDIKQGITMLWFWHFTSQASFQSPPASTDDWEMQHSCLKMFRFSSFFTFFFVRGFASIPALFQIDFEGT